MQPVSTWQCGNEHGFESLDIIGIPSLRFNQPIQVARIFLQGLGGREHIQIL